MDLKEAALFDPEAGVRHPWEVSRARAFAALLAREVGRCDAMLDVGAGDAWCAHQLAARLGAPAVTCLDAEYDNSPVTPALRARYPGSHFTSDLDTLGDTRFPLITALDVVEHVEDDLGFVITLRKRAEAGGWVLISVPAYQALFGPHDVALAHYRRYSPTALRSLVERAGLRVVARGGLFGSLLAVRALERGLARLRPDPGPKDFQGVAEFGAGRAAARIVSAALDLDARASLGVARFGQGLPGLSTWALCRAPL